MKIRELADAFTRSPEECVDLMSCVIDEIRQRKAKLPVQFDPVAEWLADATRRAICACESPIEKAFAGGFLLTFLFRAKQALLVTDPLLNAREDADGIRAALRRRRRLQRQWEQHVEDHSEELRHVSEGSRAEYLAQNPLFEDFEEYGAHMRATGTLTSDEFELLFKHPIVALGWLGWSAFIASPQSVFPALGADGQDARVDMYIWCPAQPDFQMIVECDGYEFHSAKPEFIKDRKRDRNLQRSGCHVYRFAGTELFNDMQAVADEAWRTAIGLRFGATRVELQYENL